MYACEKPSGKNKQFFLLTESYQNPKVQLFERENQGHSNVIPTFFLAFFPLSFSLSHFSTVEFELALRQRILFLFLFFFASLKTQEKSSFRSSMKPYMYCSVFLRPKMSRLCKSCASLSHHLFPFSLFSISFTLFLSLSKSFLSPYFSYYLCFITSELYLLTKTCMKRGIYTRKLQ